MESLTLKDLICEAQAFLVDCVGDPVVKVRIAGRLYAISAAPERFGDAIVFDAIDRPCDN